VISAGFLKFESLDFLMTPSPKLWLAEKAGAKPGRQKATKSGNELAAI
jgi:hypothetical protein